MNEELIFCVFKKLDTSNNGIVLDRVIDYLKPFLKYMVNNAIDLSTNSNYFVNLDIFMSKIYECINEGSLIFTNNKYYTNNNSKKYKNYIKNEQNSGENFDQILQSLNVLSLNNGSLNNESLNNGSLNNESLNNEIDENNSSEDNSSEEFNICYVILSESSNDYHLVNVELTICSCKAYEYCKSTIKTCKHLNLIKSDDRTQLAAKYPMFNIEDRICSCIEFNSNNNCIHYTSLKKYGY